MQPHLPLPLPLFRANIRRQLIWVYRTGTTPCAWHECDHPGDSDSLDQEAYCPSPSLSSLLYLRFLRPVPAPHGMRKCSFYMPKESSHTHLLEGKTNLLRLRQQIPLNDAELAAVEDGVEAMEKLLQQLADIHTPDSAMAREQNFTTTASKEGRPFEIVTRKEEDPTH